MKIVILDALTLGNDIDLSEFDELGEVEKFETTKFEEVSERIKDAVVIKTNKVVITRSHMLSAPDLKLICVTATGVNNIDLESARELGIAVANVPTYATISVAEHTFTLVFSLLKHISSYDQYVKNGKYSQSPIFSHLDFPFGEIAGKTWGIIGLGNIGKAVAKRAQAFEANVVYFSTSGKNTSTDFSRMELSELLKQSDIISIHAPLNEQTKNLIGASELCLMKPSSILVNVGRGGIVNESDLANALNTDTISGAALDVFEKEPISPENPLLKVRNPEKLILTPHIAWASRESRKKLIEELKRNIAAFLRGEKRNRVE